MSYIRHIYAAYLHSDAAFDEQEARAHSTQRKEQWTRKRELNNYAYFILLFTQLEDHINEECRKLIVRKSAAGTWRGKRLWDSIELENLNFKQRVALLAEKGGTDFNKITEYYKVRCEIAHGDSSPRRTFRGRLIHIPTIFGDMTDFLKRLRA
ncbi:MAG: hypothetical protein NTX50_12045 [Candidatus Sumerlaeota bacterium]|nr:hypothetical protein [Candidatus Sumerlaeota bacterium]